MQTVVLLFLFAILAAWPMPAGAVVSTQTVAAPQAAQPKPKLRAKPKRHVVRRWHGYGFLPGYVPPEQEPQHWDRWTHPPTWWYGGPGFYRGRWNGGGFGPCYTQTPIGPMWNCGK